MLQPFWKKVTRKVINNKPQLDMEIRIDRAWKKKTYTISRVFIDGKRFGDGENYCNALEDKDRGLTSSMPIDEILATKKYGQTAIPTGRYEVQITWSPRFKKKMPILIAVPGFTGVRIHSGNDENDTYGCVLIGRNDQIGWISNSRYWTNLLQQKIQNTLNKGEKVYITIG